MLRNRIPAWGVLAVITMLSPPVQAANEEGSAASVKPAAVAAKEPTTPLKPLKTAEAAKTAEVPKAAPAAKPVLDTPSVKVTIDLAAQRMTVSEFGDVKYSWDISSGTASHPTPRGTFRPQWTAKMWYSRKYDNAPMPNAVFIHGGVAIHATYATKMLGRPASHGCIRLAPGNAKTFYHLVHKHGLKKVRVSIYGTPKWSAPAVAKRKSPNNYASNSGSYGTTSAFDWGFSSAPTRRKAPTYYKKNGKQKYVYKKKSKYLLDDGFFNW